MTDELQEAIKRLSFRLDDHAKTIELKHREAARGHDWVITNETFGSEDMLDILTLITSVATLRTEIQRLKDGAWRPISEAPRDGQTIIIFSPHGHWRMTTYKTDPHSHVECTAATHFIPLPKPPSGDLKEGV